VAPATDAAAALDALRAKVEACTSCPLHETRTRAVFGDGDPGADLMFVGEAPGYHEDQQGRPFVGQAGKLLEQLLASIGLTREQVFIANVLKSRPPNNRDPRPDEIAACQPYLWRQIELIRPKVVCTLGNHATKLLTGNPAGITKVHGRPQAHSINGVDLYLYPIFHPAAALYTPAMLDTLKQDFLRLPELMAHAVPQAVPAAGEPGAERPAWRPPQRTAGSSAGDGQADLLSAPPTPSARWDAPATGSSAAGDPAADAGSGAAVAAGVASPAADLASPAADAASPADEPEPPAADPRPDIVSDAPASTSRVESGPPEQLGLF